MVTREKASATLLRANQRAMLLDAFRAGETEKMIAFSASSRRAVREQIMHGAARRPYGVGATLRRHRADGNSVMFHY